MGRGSSTHRRPKPCRTGARIDATLLFARPARLPEEQLEAGLPQLEGRRMTRAARCSAGALSQELFDDTIFE